MSVTIGIPQALAYYDYFPFWQTFFSNLGAQLVISPKTNQAIVREGVRRAVDGTCFPVKIFYGHVHWLIEAGVERLFLPRLVSVAPKEYICPKFMGLPDMMAAAFPGGPGVYSPVLDLNRPRKYSEYEMGNVAKDLGCSSLGIRQALEQGGRAQRQHEMHLQEGNWPTQDRQNQWEDSVTLNESTQLAAGSFPFPILRIGLLGHSYLIYDDFANMQIVARLKKMGAEVLTVDMLPSERIAAQAAKWRKRMFWTSGRRILGAAWEYVEMPVDGIVYITAFGCGTDSLTAELVERTVRRHSRIPQLILNLDEHTGEAGVVTRLEAFVDMLRWRQTR